MEQCTDTVWVTAMDVPSIRGLSSGLEILRRLDLQPETRHVVLNWQTRSPASASRTSRRP